MVEKKHILLTPASEMTWADPSRYKHGMVRDLHSSNENLRVRIYTPGEKAPIMTSAAHQAAAAADRK